MKRNYSRDSFIVQRTIVSAFSLWIFWGLSGRSSSGEFSSQTFRRTLFRHCFAVAAIIRLKLEANGEQWNTENYSFWKSKTDLNEKLNRKKFGHQGEVNHLARAWNFFHEKKPEDFNKTFFIGQHGLIKSIQTVSLRLRLQWKLCSSIWI